MFKPKILTVGLAFVVLFFSLTGCAYGLDFPSPTGYVNDFADLIEPDQQQRLEERLVALEATSSVEVTVVTVTDLQGVTVEEFAVELFASWGIGKAGADNGLLILVARDERKVKIEPGYGLEPVITDGRAGRIIRDQMTPAFREGNYGTGIEAAVEQIEGYITGEITDPEPAPVSANESTGVFIFFIALLIYATSFLGRTKRVWPGAVVGGLLGWLANSSTGTGGWLVFVFGFFGLLLDIIFSANYKQLKKKGLPTSWRSSRGGFWSGGGGSGGGGFGGFGGGSSGGGGASGSW